MTIGSKTTVIFVTFAHQVPARSRPLHNSVTEPIPPNLSCPQAQRWKSAKMKKPSHNLAARHNSRRPANMVVIRGVARRSAANPAMAAPAGGVESNKGVSERLSAPGGKSTRVQRESPSKAPKNGSQTVL